MFISFKILKNLPVKRKQTIGVVVTDETRERVKRVAEVKHWSVSQTLSLFIDAYWDTWEKDLGVAEKPSTTPKKKSKS